MSYDLTKAAKNHGFDEAYLIPGIFVENAAHFGLHDLRQIMPQAKSVLLLIKKHRPFKPFPKGAMTVHSHYPAYQKAYELCKSFTDKLNNMGIDAAAADMLPLKNYAAKAGLPRLKNSLTYHKEFGSYFVLQAIAVDMESEPKPEMQNDVCGDCTKCIDACPAGAIREDGRVDQYRCIRNHVPVKAFIPYEMREMARTGYIGCGVCQSVCPLNNKIHTVAPPEELCEALSLEAILDIKSDNQSLKELGQLIGKNEARPGRAIATACMIAGNTGEKKYISFLEDILLNYINPLARGYAAWALGKIGSGEKALEKALAQEHNPEAKSEIKTALKCK